MKHSKENFLARLQPKMKHSKGNFFCAPSAQNLKDSTRADSVSGEEFGFFAAEPFKKSEKFCIHFEIFPRFER